MLSLGDTSSGSSSGTSDGSGVCVAVGRGVSVVSFSGVELLPGSGDGSGVADWTGVASGVGLPSASPGVGLTMMTDSEPPSPSLLVGWDVFPGRTLLSVAKTAGTVEETAKTKTSRNIMILFFPFIAFCACALSSLQIDFV